jgi:hypothetical protein
VLAGIDSHEDTLAAAVIDYAGRPLVVRQAGRRRCRQAAWPTCLQGEAARETSRGARQELPHDRTDGVRGPAPSRERAPRCGQLAQLSARCRSSKCRPSEAGATPNWRRLTSIGW